MAHAGKITITIQVLDDDNNNKPIHGNRITKSFTGAQLVGAQDATIANDNPTGDSFTSVLHNISSSDFQRVDGSYYDLVKSGDIEIIVGQDAINDEGHIYVVTYEE